MEIYATVEFVKGEPIFAEFSGRRKASAVEILLNG